MANFVAWSRHEIVTVLLAGYEQVGASLEPLRIFFKPRLSLSENGIRVGHDSPFPLSPCITLTRREGSMDFS